LPAETKQIKTNKSGFNNHGFEAEGFACGAHVRLAATGSVNTTSIVIISEGAATAKASATETSSNRAADEVVGGGAASVSTLHVVEVTMICKKKQAGVLIADRWSLNSSQTKVSYRVAAVCTCPEG